VKWKRHFSTLSDGSKSDLQIWVEREITERHKREKKAVQNAAITIPS
jgi:hypothetical protein